MTQKRNALRTSVLTFILLLVSFASIQAADSLTAYGIIQKYLTAIGGRDKLSAVNDRRTEMEGTVQKVNVSMVIYQKQPDKFKQVIHAGDVVQEILYSQDKGYMKINGKISSINGDELAKLKNDATLNLLLHLDTNNVHLTYLGIDTVNGNPAYKVLLKNSSLNWIHYYDVKSFLKLMDEKPVKAVAGVYLQQTWYFDYRYADGILFPFKIKQKLGKQEMEFNVTNIKINSGIPDEEFKSED
jgi:outer membrane lipoprotein-sorting protein